MLILLIALQAPASSAPFDFQGTAIGSSVAEFRANPPVNPSGRSSRVVCSDEAGVPTWIQPPREEASVGVTRCAVTENIGSSALPASVALGPDYSALAQFYFWQGRLFRIGVFPDIGALGIVESSLTTRFGPGAETQSEMQVRSGAVFPQRIVSWRRGGQSITLTAPDMRTTKMSVFYEDEQAVANVENQISASRSPVM